MRWQETEAISGRLATLTGRSQAQLDGFKSRALRERSPTQRHLYTVEWCRCEAAERAGAEMLAIGEGDLIDREHHACHVSHAELVSSLCDGAWQAATAAVAMSRGSFGVLSPVVLEVALALVQSQAITMPVLR